MTYYARGGILTATNLTGAWEKVPQETKDILEISMGEHKISAKEQFETFWLDVPLVYLEAQLEHAERMFLIILAENQFLIEKIKNQGKIIASLSNFDNWGDTTNLTYENKMQGLILNDNKGKSSTLTEQTGKNESTETTKTGTKTDALTKSGNSDDNSYSEEFNTMLEETDASDMPINAMSQGRNIGAVDVEGTNNNLLNLRSETTQQVNNEYVSTGKTNQLHEYKSNTFTSNKAKDFRNYLRLELETDFRLKLWGKFKKIFINA